MFRTSVSPNSGHGRELIFSQARTIFLVSILICLAALAGIYSRPAGFLAAFWPANAILATLLVRAARWRRLPILLGAICGYQAAGYLTGDVPWTAVQLTMANLVSAVSFAFVYTSLGERDSGFASARSVPSLAGSAVVAAAAAGVAGAAVLAHMSGGSLFDAWRTWFASELMNYLVLLPGLLSVQWPLSRPQLAQIKTFFVGPLVVPVVAVIVTTAMALLTPHPVAIVFPVPALIWVALVMPLPATCFLVMLYSGVTMFAVKLHVYDFGSGLSDDLIASIHLGVAMIALGPVLVATFTAERRRQFVELQRVARIDDLTEALNRGTFFNEGVDRLRPLKAAQEPVAVILVDADHFKRVNDVYGHAAGDMALVALSAAIRKSIRYGDMFGRLGGEEFGLLLPGTPLDDARIVAERLRVYVERMQTTLASGDILQLTVSIGVSVAPKASSDLAEMLLFADRAMYEAKRAGRNRVHIHEMPA